MGGNLSRRFGMGGDLSRGFGRGAICHVGLVGGDLSRRFGRGRSVTVKCIHISYLARRTLLPVGGSQVGGIEDNSRVAYNSHPYEMSLCNDTT